jgi:hypothetical protein
MVVGEEPKVPSPKTNDPTLTSSNEALLPALEYAVAELT